MKLFFCFCVNCANDNNAPFICSKSEDILFTLLNAHVCGYQYDDNFWSNSINVHQFVTLRYNSIFCNGNILVEKEMYSWISLLKDFIYKCTFQEALNVELIKLTAYKTPGIDESISLYNQNKSHFIIQYIDNIYFILFLSLNKFSANKLMQSSFFDSNTMLCIYCLNFMDWVII